MNEEIIVLIKELAEVLMVPIAGAIAVFIVKLVQAYSARVQAQTNNENINKYIRLAEQVVTDAVMATNQTFVDVQKVNGTFDKEAWATAFAKTQAGILKMLTEAEKEALAQAYGDINTWLEIKIEAEVKRQKNELACFE